MNLKKRKLDDRVSDKCIDSTFYLIYGIVKRMGFKMKLVNNSIARYNVGSVAQWPPNNISYLPRHFSAQFFKNAANFIISIKHGIDCTNKYLRSKMFKALNF